jgi:hypothetical protein
MNKLKFLTLTIIFVMAAVFVVPRVMTVQAAAPANDDFSDATVVNGLPFSETLITTDATTEPGDPGPCGNSYYPDRSVWYSFTPTESMYVQISTEGSNYYTAVGVYTGSYDSLSEVNCTSRNAYLTTSLSAGTTYYFEVVWMGASYPGPGEGDFSLHLTLTQVVAPSNDNFADAKIVDGMPYQDSVDNTAATVEPGEPAGCSYNGPVKTIWYAYTPANKGILSGNASYLTVYTGNTLDSLTQITCTSWDNSFQTSVSPGTTYYIQLGSVYDSDSGHISVYLNFTPAPANDDFANAMVVGDIPFSNTVYNASASTESGEPNPGCYWDNMYRTIWYAYTPSTSGSITFERSGFYYSFSAVYAGSSLDTLTLLRCAAYEYSHFTLHVDPGVTYYIQLGSAYYSDYGNLTLDLYVPPPPNVDFWWSPGDPNRFDTVQFCDSSNDPGGEGSNYFWWNFGDGTQLETTDSCVYHQFKTDNDYSVWHKVQTNDGRTGETTKVISVRTHDVAITKFAVPQSAKVGQTRAITVGIRNSKYPENVTVDLYKSTPYGFTWVGALSMYVPVRPSNRTTDFNFSYTFTNDDGKAGKVTFKAVARLDSARDALPADNEAIALPTKVGGYSPYAATIVNPSNKVGAASTFGLLALGLAFGFLTVKGRPK